MKFIDTPLSGLYVIQHKKIDDDRGFFARTYCKNQFRSISFEKEFVQFNHSFNSKRGTVRGMHFQSPPFAETKLIRCIQGSVLDVVVDLRIKSPTFLKYFEVELDSRDFKSVLIPEGFAHGFQTLEDNSALIYHHTEFYIPGADSGLRHDDPKLGIKWPLPIAKISEKDQSYGFVSDNFQGI
jgi:dTDP-4-dehydrorhamnose 3,5-epimerase